MSHPKGDPKPELDLLGECDRLFFYQGAALFAVMGSDARHRDLASKLWEQVPFLKALAQLARNHQNEARDLWATARREPMPFGGDPVDATASEAAS